MLALPAPWQLRKVEIAQAAHAPVEHHRSLDLMMERVLDHRLDRRKACSPRDEDHRLVGAVAQIERAERTFKAQNLAASVLVEQLIAEKPAGYVADMQFEKRIILGRGGDGEAAAPPVLEQQVDVLPGEI